MSEIIVMCNTTRAEEMLTDEMPGRQVSHLALPAAECCFSLGMFKKAGESKQMYNRALYRYTAPPLYFLLFSFVGGSPACRSEDVMFSPNFCMCTRYGMLYIHDA